MDLTGPKVSQPLVPLVGLQEIEPHTIPLLKVAMDSIKLRYQTPCLMVRLSLYAPYGQSSSRQRISQGSSFR